MKKTQVIPRKSFAKREIQPIPNVRKAFEKLVTGHWLQDDNDIQGARERFVSVNVNLSLVCALLFTTYLPIYYSEPSRINNNTDGFTLDFSWGFLSSKKLVNINADAIHDIFDTAYLIAMAGTLFGTLIAVYYSIAGSVCFSDEKVVVLKQKLGALVALPYWFFSSGAIGWGIGVWLHLVLVPRTTAGWVLKVIILVTMIIGLVLAMPLMVQGVYISHHEEQNCSSLRLTKEEVEKGVEEYFVWIEQENANKENSGMRRDADLTELMTSLRTQISPYGYISPLSETTKLMVTKVYYERIGRDIGMTAQEVKAFLKS